MAGGALSPGRGGECSVHVDLSPGRIPAWTVALRRRFVARKLVHAEG